MKRPFIRAVRQWWWDWDCKAARHYSPCKRCDGSGFDGPNCPGSSLDDLCSQADYICDDCAGIRAEPDWHYYGWGKRAWFTIRLIAQGWFWRWQLRRECRRWLMRKQAAR